MSSEGERSALGHVPATRKQEGLGAELGHISRPLEQHFPD